MLPEHLPLRPPDPPGGTTAAARCEPSDEAPRHELATQRNRAITYGVACISIALSWAAGMLDLRARTTLTVFAVGLLSVGGFSWVARRAARAGRRVNLAPWWIACDMVLVTAMVWITGGVSSPWFLWYLGCAGAAAMHLGLRLAVAGGLTTALLYLGALVGLGQVRGPGQALYLAVAHLVFLFGASFILLANARRLRRSIGLNRRLRLEADVRVEELTRVTGDLEAMSRLLRDFTEADPLTGLHNRRYLLDRLEDDAQRLGTDRRAGSAGAGAGILVIDVDHLQRINEAGGRAAGDEVLKHLARVLRRCVRGEDRLVRWGGDEFLILLAHSGLARIDQVAERVLAAVRSKPCILAGLQSQPVTCSVGWSVFAWRPRPDGAPPWEGALAAAEAALEAAKNEGRDCCRHLTASGTATAADLAATDAGAAPAADLAIAGAAGAAEAAPEPVPEVSAVREAAAA